MSPTRSTPHTTPEIPFSPWAVWGPPITPATRTRPFFPFFSTNIWEPTEEELARNRAILKQRREEKMLKAILEEKRVPPWVQRALDQPKPHNIPLPPSPKYNRTEPTPWSMVVEEHIARINLLYPLYDCSPRELAVVENKQVVEASPEGDVKRFRQWADVVKGTAKELDPPAAIKMKRK